MPLWLYWILLGLVAGTLAKFLVPGRDPSGCIVTIILGIVGSVIGGFLGTRFGWGAVNAGALDLRSIGLATLGAIVLLLLGRVVRRL
ncbi:MAG TPA: GlsB/YeaQ/YmgE family stress response membrane protein [Gemmatimonadaceae bacterium]|nr:GlsB/YeaQ/YmgE family stress response membrane protein [Gemmatimonadaceae bacterium]